MKTIIKGIFACLYMSKISKKTYDHTKPADRQKALSGFYKIEHGALIDEELAREVLARIHELQREELDQYLVDSYTILFT
jgi:hypothetical protein